MEKRKFLNLYQCITLLCTTLLLPSPGGELYSTVPCDIGLYARALYDYSFRNWKTYLPAMCVRFLIQLQNLELRNTVWSMFCYFTKFNKHKINSMEQNLPWEANSRLWINSLFHETERPLLYSIKPFIESNRQNILSNTGKAKGGRIDLKWS